MAEANKVVPLKPKAKAAPKTKTKAKTKVAIKKGVKKPATKKTAPKAAKKIVKKTVKKATKPTAKKAAPKKAAAKKIVKKTIAKKAAPKKAIKKAVKKVTPAAKKAAFKKQATVSTKPQIKTQPTNPQMETIMTQGQKAQAQFDQFTKDAANLNQEGIDAFVKSGTLFAKGFEAIMKETMSFAQSTAEKQMQLAKDAMTSKTINEFSDAQNKLAQTSFDDFMSGTTKITELGVKVVTEAIEPINEQVQKSVQKATDAVAAE